jgi:CRISPR/Cas system CSM-associated protein Csm3 (group 7 of RAMP superfamily)
MARKITTRWKVTGTITAITPLHIGGVGGDADTDLALAVNGASKYYVPGTSMAGALRGWMTQLLNNESQIKDMWGDHEDPKRGASFILVEDAEIILPNNSDIEIREGVGIDRHSGTAAERCKYSRAIIPKGSTFPIHLTFDSQDQAGNLPESLIQLLCALEAGDIRLGAAKTRGLGRIKLSDPQIHAFAINTPQGIFDSLLKSGSQENWKQLKESVNYQSPPYLGIKITWHPKDPVMVKAEGDGLAIDILPLVSQVGNDVRFVIPGSSLKGVLRTQAERIIRTLSQTAATENNFLIQLRELLVNELFGSAAAGKDDLGKIGALAVDDCFSQLTMTPSQWGDVENATEMTGDLPGALRNVVGNQRDPYKILQPAMHVAVDRWTGGAAEGMLYSVLEPIGVTWEPIQIHLDIARMKNYYHGKEEKLKPAIALLLLVLRDLANKKIPVGYGTNRGMGTIAVNQITLNGKALPTDLQPLDTTMTCPNLTDLDEAFRQDLSTAWKKWIDNPIDLCQPQKDTVIQEAA